MRSKSIAVGAAAGAGMLVLILDAGTASEGMRQGMELCVKVLIPSLFPFFVLSVLMTGNLMGAELPILKPLGRLLGIPTGAVSVLVPGFLGGYPVGAQAIADAWRRGNLSREDAERMLGFCNNAGPAFLFGVLGRAFETPWIPWALWGIHMISALVVGSLTRKPPASSSGTITCSSQSLPGALRSAIAAMAQVCGWVVLFRMVIAYLDRWILWLLPGDVRVLLCGVLELSNGCADLGVIAREGSRMIAAGFMLGLGGLCVGMQTASAAGTLSLRYYFPGKLAQAFLSALLACGTQLLLPVESRAAFSPAFAAGMGLCGLLSLVILRKMQKNSSIPLSVGV